MCRSHVIFEEPQRVSKLNPVKAFGRLSLRMQVSQGQRRVLTTCGQANVLQKTISNAISRQLSDTFHQFSLSVQSCHMHFEVKMQLAMASRPSCMVTWYHTRLSHTVLSLGTLADLMGMCLSVSEKEPQKIQSASKTKGMTLHTMMDNVCVFFSCFLNLSWLLHWLTLVKKIGIRSTGKDMKILEMVLERQQLLR